MATTTSIMIFISAMIATQSSTVDTSDHLNNSTIATFDLVTKATEEDANKASEMPTCDKVLFAVGGVLMAIMCLFGLVGNTLSTLTFWPTMSKNATSFLLIGLALYDDGVCIIWLINSSFTRLCIYIGCVGYLRYEFRYLYQYLWPIGSTCHLAGTWMVVLVTFHRFMAVCYPHSVNKFCSLRKAKIHVICIGVLAFVVNVPRALDEYLVPNADGTSINHLPLYPNPMVYQYLYEVAIYYLLIYVIPVTFLVMMTYRLLKALSTTTKKRQQMTRSKRDEQDLTKTLIVVVVVFMICQTMNPIRRLLVIALTPEQQACGTVGYYWSTVSGICVVFNSCGNFVIYCIFSPRFRRTLKRNVCNLKRRVYPETTVSTIHSLANMPHVTDPPSG